MGCRNLKLSKDILGLDNDARNSYSMFVAPLTTLRDERRDTIIVELHIRTMLIDHAVKEETDGRTWGAMIPSTRETHT